MGFAWLVVVLDDRWRFEPRGNILRECAHFTDAAILLIWMKTMYFKWALASANRNKNGWLGGEAKCL